MSHTEAAKEVEQAEAPKGKKAVVIQTVTMDDGRVVEFAGKKRMKKETTISATGEIHTRLDFVNGEVRSYKVTPEMLPRFAAHGVEQKLGDEIAGVDDIADAVEAIDELLIRLEKGEWTAERAAGTGGQGKGNSLSGASILVRALVEMTGKDVRSIREALMDKTPAEKAALRRNPRLRPIIERLESEKAAKKEEKSGINSDDLLEGIVSSEAETV